MPDVTISEDAPVVMTRREAIAAGLKHYYSGTPCVRGHLSKRYTSSGSCLMCQDESRNNLNYEGAQCSVEGCGRRRERKGYCPKHHVMWKKHGDPLKPPSRVKGAALEWIEKHLRYNDEACLIWPFGSAGAHKRGGVKRKVKTGNRGYGQATFNGKNLGAHVLMCMLAHGDKPFEGAIATHSCGNGHLGCVAPNHLSWSTYAGNAADRVRHGTQTKGEKSSNTKLTDHDVRKIRSLQGEMTVKRIAEMFGIGQSAVKRIHDRKTWAHLD